MRRGSSRGGEGHARRPSAACAPLPPGPPPSPFKYKVARRGQVYTVCAMRRPKGVGLGRLGRFHLYSVKIAIILAHLGRHPRNTTEAPRSHHNPRSLPRFYLVKIAIILGHLARHSRKRTEAPRSDVILGHYRAFTRSTWYYIDIILGRSYRS